MTTPTPALAIDGLAHRYGDFRALRGVTLSVADGELFGLLGPNGAGKTTLISLLNGLIPVQAGSVQLFGRPFDPRDAGQRRLVGLATQDLAIYGELTARENLRFFGKLYGLRGDALEARVGELLDAVVLGDRADDRAGTFSGGMKRRLNLAVAVVHGPRLLFLDEPTTGVDPQSRNHIFEHVRRLNREGMTVVYTSHYMEEVESLCPRLAIVDHGAVIACDMLPALLRLLPGRIRLRTRPDPVLLAERLAGVSGVAAAERSGDVLEVRCDSVPATLLEVVARLPECGLELVALETAEPNLERVFLHLTGHGLRD